MAAWEGKLRLETALTPSVVGPLVERLDAELTRACAPAARPPCPPVLQKVVEEIFLRLSSAAATLAEICSRPYGVSTIHAKL
jgi:hypothetical protein